MFEAVHAEVDDQGNSQGYGALNMKEKMDSGGFEKGAIDGKNE